MSELKIVVEIIHEILVVFLVIIALFNISISGKKKKRKRWLASLTDLLHLIDCLS